jgi:Flp pilus assembly protein TadD
MMIPDPKTQHSTHWIALVLLFFLILIPYSNSFRASWHFDDFPKIINNPVVKISNLKPRTLYQTFFTTANNADGNYQKKKIYRPISSLTFALNWYVGQYNVFGYHAVNISIHFLIAFILFLTLSNLFKTPNLKDKYPGSEYFIALLTASLWAINPIQTQAVTYIVQRMAALSALFYLLGIYLYLKARMADPRPTQVFFYTAGLLSYLFALAAKENSATLPVALILLEIIFFQDFSDPRIRKRFLGITLGVGFCIFVLGAWLYLQGDPSSIFKGYERRSFSPLQRLMTEPRILVFYLSQIFYPAPTSLSIEHYVPISTSVFNPWTTLPSIVFVFGLIGFGFYQMRKNPILSFAILFFFLNHFIESTILGLELIFEHRNYLPSFFIFFPVSVGIKWLLDYYCKKKRSMYFVITSSIILLIIAVGVGTHIRNMVWATEKTLWEDAIAKAPQMSRPYHNLAWGYYEKIGQYDQARFLYEKSISLLKHNNYGKSLVINNLANYYYLKRDLRKACELWATTVRLNPNNGVYEYRRALCLAEMGESEKALAAFNKFLSKYPHHRNSLNLKGRVLLKQGRFQEALSCFRHVLKLYRNDTVAMTNLGMGFRRMGDGVKAEWFLKTAHVRDPNNIMILLWLIEVNQFKDDENEADRYIQKLFTINNFKKLSEGLNRLGNTKLMPRPAREKLISAIALKLKEDVEKIPQLIIRKSQIGYQ